MDGKISNLEQVASLRRYTLTQGRGKGLDVIDCDNGCIRFLLNVTKACDMMQLYHKGQNLSFVSKNGFQERALSFGKRFEGGMLYTCGLDSVGERDGFEEHGTIHNIPAEILRAECNSEGIVVEAVIRDTEMAGKNLALHRTITTPLLGKQVSIQDRLVNAGFREETYCLLYHVNLGYPLLDEGVEVVFDSTSVLPRTPWAAQNAETAREISAPVPGREETCYYLTPRDDRVALVNKAQGKAFTVSYSGNTLPHFLLWKSMASGDYAVGLEPATTKLDDAFAASTIGAGESILFRVDLRVDEMT